MEAIPLASTANEEVMFDDIVEETDNFILQDHFWLLFIMNDILILYMIMLYMIMLWLCYDYVVCIISKCYKRLFH